MRLLSCLAIVLLLNSGIINACPCDENKSDDSSVTSSTDSNSDDDADENTQ